MQQNEGSEGGGEIPDDRYDIPGMARTSVNAGVRVRWLFAKPTIFSYMKMLTDSLAISRKERGKTPMWINAQMLITITTA